MATVKNKPKPAAVTEQQIVERLCRMSYMEQRELKAAAEYLHWISQMCRENAKPYARQIAAMLVKGGDD